MSIYFSVSNSGWTEQDRSLYQSFTVRKEECEKEGEGRVGARF